MKQIRLSYDSSLESVLEKYEVKFKALSDKKRLQIMHELSQRGNTCVCDLIEILGIPQSKLSYHLKILLDAELIIKETIGTWSYYQINEIEIVNLVSKKLSGLLFPHQGE